MSYLVWYAEGLLFALLKSNSWSSSIYVSTQGLAVDASSLLETSNTDKGWSLCKTCVGKHQNVFRSMIAWPMAVTLHEMSTGEKTDACVCRSSIRRRIQRPCVLYEHHRRCGYTEARSRTNRRCGGQVVDRAIDRVVENNFILLVWNGNRTVENHTWLS